ncbi:MAG: DUF1461 domain-containing protein [Candidatus Woesearchaeota archaeon]|nr:MAG: DUF1461 domain-containing protein [Candidatus Woesearchaeota archaeon]
MKALPVITALAVFLFLLNSIFIFEMVRSDELRSFYFSGKELSNLFSPDEVTHMQEVKFLTMISITINAVLAPIIIARRKEINRHQLGKYLLIASAVLFIAAIFFPIFFILFHKVFFPFSTTWLLPSNSFLIQTYPQSFFQDRFLGIIFIAASLGAVLRCKN